MLEIRVHCCELAAEPGGPAGPERTYSESASIIPCYEAAPNAQHGANATARVSAHQSIS